MCLICRNSLANKFPCYELPLKCGVFVKNLFKSLIKGSGYFAGTGYRNILDILPS